MNKKPKNKNPKNKKGFTQELFSKLSKYVSELNEKGGTRRRKKGNKKKKKTDEKRYIGKCAQPPPCWIKS